jgi:hypothetical protein
MSPVDAQILQTFSKYGVGSTFEIVLLETGEVLTFCESRNAIWPSGPIPRIEH